MSGPFDIGSLQRDMDDVRAAAEAIAGRPMLGLRPVDAGTGGRTWLVAFEGPAFLCLDAARDPVRSLARARDVAQVGVAAEAVDDAVDAAALRAVRPEADLLAGLVGVARADVAGGGAGGAPTGDVQVGVRGGADEPPRPLVAPAAVEALARAARAAERLAEWRDDEARAVASLVALDEAVSLQGRAHAAYATFASLTEPLVERQGELRPDLLAALVGVEQAAAAAGLGASLGAMLGEAMGGIVEAADEMARAHITPLS